MFKRAFVSGLAAVAITAGTLAAAVQPSAAGPHHHHHNRDLALGLGIGLGGFLLGNALVQPRPVVVDDYGSLHVRRCMARYRSYDPSTDTYIGYDGYPHYCRL